MVLSLAPSRLTASAVILAAFVLAPLAAPAAQPFERVATDVGNTGLSVTNAGTLGRPGVATDPAGLPSFEYPLNSGIEHLFEAGLWVGARRADGVVSVRTGAVTSSGGYSPGAPGFEFAQEEVFQRRSSLQTSPFFSPAAVSQQDFLTAYTDTLALLPGTSTPLPDVQNQLGLSVRQRSYAWSFPFTEYFVIVEYDITNVSSETLTDLWVGLWDDLVVRNVVTTTDGGGAFFNKGARGVLGYPEYEGGTGALVNADPDSQYVSYAFNAGGTEESLNTYGSIAFLGAEWDDPGASGRPAARRFFHPNVASEYAALNLPAPRFNPRFWLFGGNDPDPALARPSDDLDRYQRMMRPYPDPAAFSSDAAYEAARAAFLGMGQGQGRIQTDGRISAGNWIGLTSVGPFAALAPGQSVTVTFALVAALKPEEFQSVPVGRETDTPEARELLRNNVFWAQETYAGEDANYNGVLDPGEDINGNGVLDRYLIPEPPASPPLRVELEQGKAVLYWTDFAEQSVDPVTGRTDFEGYRIYRSDPGDDLDGNILGQAGLIAQYDRPGNDVGFNNGLEPIRLASARDLPRRPERVPLPLRGHRPPRRLAVRLRRDGLRRGRHRQRPLPARVLQDEQRRPRLPRPRRRSLWRPGRLPQPLPRERGVGRRALDAAQALLLQSPRAGPDSGLLPRGRDRGRDGPRRRDLHRRHPVVQRLQRPRAHGRRRHPRLGHPLRQLAPHLQRALPLLRPGPRHRRDRDGQVRHPPVTPEAGLWRRRSLPPLLFFYHEKRYSPCAPWRCLSP